MVDCGTGLWTRRYGPRLLLAVDGALNEQKGDADAASWLPPYD